MADPGGLVDWARARGAVVHERLAFFAPVPAAGDRGDGPAERQVVATRPIRRGELLLELPPSCVLPPPAADSPLAEAFDALEPRPTAFLAAALQLLHLTASTCGSAWGPYLAALPRTYPCPSYWSDEQLDRLDGTMVSRDVVRCSPSPPPPPDHGPPPRRVLTPPLCWLPGCSPQIDRVERQRLGLDTPERGSEGCGGPRHALREAYERYVVPLSSQRPALFPAERCSLAGPPPSQLAGLVWLTC